MPVDAYAYESTNSQMKSLPLIFILTVAALAFTQDQSITAGPIDFYGYAGLDLDRIRAALPLHEDDQLSRESKEKTIDRLKQSVKQTAGREPSDVATICCDDRGRLLIYIGLPGRSAHHIQYNTVPHGSIRLPPPAIRAYREADEAWSNAMARGVSGEDDSLGYALSLDPEARAK